VKGRRAALGALAAVAVLAAVYVGYMVPRRHLESLPAVDLEGAEAPVAALIDERRAQVQERPSSGRDWGRLAIALDVHDYRTEALACYAKAHELEPSEFLWTYFAAIAAKRDASEEVGVWFERALAVRDDYAPLYVRLGQLQLETGEHDAAQTSFTRALELDSSTIFARLGLARLLLLRGELEASAEQLAAAEQTRPGFREAYGVLADVYRRMGRVEELVWLRRQLARMPDATPMADPLLQAEWAPHGASAFWHDQRGKQAARRGDYSTAIREHEKAIAIRPRAVFLNNHAVALEGAERVDEALATLEAALQLDPGLAVLYINRASLLRDAGRHEQAITTLREGLARAPTDITLIRELAWALATAPDASLEAGRDAVALCRRVLQREAGPSAETLDLLAMGEATSGRLPEAVRLAREALEMAASEQDDELSRQIAGRLEGYRSGRRYIER